MTQDAKKPGRVELVLVPKDPAQRSRWTEFLEMLSKFWPSHRTVESTGADLVDRSLRAAGEKLDKDLHENRHLEAQVAEALQKARHEGALADVAEQSKAADLSAREAAAVKEWIAVEGERAGVTKTRAEAFKTAAEGLKLLNDILKESGQTVTQEMVNSVCRLLIEPASRDVLTQPGMLAMPTDMTPASLTDGSFVDPRTSKPLHSHLITGILEPPKSTPEDLLELKAQLESPQPHRVLVLDRSVQGASQVSQLPSPQARKIVVVGHSAQGGPQVLKSGAAKKKAKRKREP